MAGTAVARGGAGALIPSGPWSYPSPDHEPHRSFVIVDETSQSGLIAPGESAEVLSIKVDEGEVLRIAEVGFDALNPIALALATWEIRRSPVPVTGFRPRPTTVGSLRKPSQVYAWVEGPATVQVFVTNNSPGSYWRYFSRLVGYLYRPHEVKS